VLSLMSKMIERLLFTYDYYLGLAAWMQRSEIRDQWHRVPGFRCAASRLQS
jgi:hypothetical protein